MPGGDSGDAYQIKQRSNGGWEWVFNLPVVFNFLNSGGGMTPQTETPAGTIDGANRAFTLSQTPATGRPVRVYSDNIRVPRNQYTVVGTTLTFIVGSLYIPSTELDVDYFT